MDMVVGRVIGDESAGNDFHDAQRSEIRRTVRLDRTPKNLDGRQFGQAFAGGRPAGQSEHQIGAISNLARGKIRRPPGWAEKAAEVRQVHRTQPGRRRTGIRAATPGPRRAGVLPFGKRGYVPPFAVSWKW